ncbi:hypothetical protein 56301_44 [Lactococcus phage 56301]|uniref:Uncharacterized protein n=1 Tax=Lactococcus phage 56301 TaxID=2029666 RepID=A0A343JPQ2_9CAUD|nr:hypothetical protein HYP32_gp44 [Lactococcus phage 56301]ASZ71475.1 hypothetical protein 56301_44 [Lactococcus phage 56301]
MVVKLTQEQTDYLETFREIDKAIYYISRWGWCHALKDGNEKVYGGKEKEPFEQAEKLKMVEAVINGYEVIVHKFKFYNFSDSSGGTTLYYAGKIKQLTGSKRFALEVEKDSEEYKALLTLGFIEEEV